MYIITVKYTKKQYLECENIQAYLFTLILRFVPTPWFFQEENDVIDSEGTERVGREWNKQRFWTDVMKWGETERGNCNNENNISQASVLSELQVGYIAQLD